MFLRLALLFTVVPLVELYLLIEVGRLIGVAATIAIVVLTGVLGAWLARLQGLRIVNQVRADLEAGRVPTDAILDGLLILVAGAVLLTPGLITDALGFTLLIPAGRRLARQACGRLFASRQGSQQPPDVIDVSWRRTDEPPDDST